MKMDTYIAKFGLLCLVYLSLTILPTVNAAIIKFDALGLDTYSKINSSINEIEFDINDLLRDDVLINSAYIDFSLTDDKDRVLQDSELKNFYSDWWKDPIEIRTTNTYYENESVSLQYKDEESSIFSQSVSMNSPELVSSERLYYSSTSRGPGYRCNEVWLLGIPYWVLIDSDTCYDPITIVASAERDGYKTLYEAHESQDVLQFDYTLSDAMLLDILEDGLLTLGMTVDGDYMDMSASLLIDYDIQPIQVLEPRTIFLFILILLGMLYRFKSKIDNN